MVNKILINMLPLLFSMITPDLLKKAVDALIDVVEDAVKNSSNKIDDMVVLPMCRLIRNTFDIPDND